MRQIELSTAVNAEIEKVSEIASYLWEREWAERNAGNISINLTGMVEPLSRDTDGFRFVPQDLPSDVAGMTLFVTGTGERLRDLRTMPEQVACVLQVNETATGYHIIWGGLKSADFRPTSEFISHLKIHKFRSDDGSGHRVIIHTHPIELLCMSHNTEYNRDEERFNFCLWSMLPEIRVFVPKGMALAPYALPGSEELADITVEGLRHRDVVVWLKHGALSTGRDAIEAWDFLDVANKGAKIFLKCLASGFVPEGMTAEEMKGLEVYL